MWTNSDVNREHSSSHQYSSNALQRPAGLLAQVRMVFLQPRRFFRTQRTATSQQWLPAALIVLALVGASAIRQQQLASGQGSFAASSANSSLPAADGQPSTPDISLTWKPALTAASEMILNWILLSILLIIVSMSNSLKPQFDHNLNVVIWASLPLGLMAGLQLLYYSSGGQPGQPGLSGLVSNLPGFNDLPALTQTLLMSFSARLTIFWLWNLALLYLGARYALGGMRFVVIVTLGLWIAWLVLLPLAVDSFNTRSTDPLPTLMPFSDSAQSP